MREAHIHYSPSGVLFARRREQTECQGIELAARPIGRLAQRLESLHQLLRSTIDRHPTVAIGDRAFGPFLRLRAQHDRRTARLDRLRIAPHWTKIDEFAVVFGDLVGPDLLHRLDTLTQDLPALFKLGAV